MTKSRAYRIILRRGKTSANNNRKRGSAEDKDNLRIGIAVAVAEAVLDLAAPDHTKQEAQGQSNLQHRQHRLVQPELLVV